jgi:hypothetical protein
MKDCTPRRHWNDTAAKAIFRKTMHYESPPADLLGGKRRPESDAEPQCIRLLSSKLDRPVFCESGAEQRVFSWLEHCPEVRWYQEQPTAVPYSLGGRSGFYYPDAAVLDSSGRMVVIEVKPLYTMYRLETLIKAMAALDHFGTRGIGYLLLDPHGQTPSDLARIRYDGEVADTLESFLTHGPMSFGLLKRLLVMKHGRFELRSFVSMVINRDWSVTSAPGLRISNLQGGLSFRELRASPTSMPSTATS